MLYSTPFRASLLVATLGVSATASAQTLPAFDAGKALQETRPAPSEVPRKAPVEPVILQKEDKPLALPAGQTLMVAAFRFEGAELVAEEDLQAAVAAFKGKALSMAEIEQAAGRITALFRQRGYLVARAYVPRQDASGGTLTIRVIVGQYGKVSIQNHSRVRDERIEGYFGALRGERPIARADLERVMLLLNDLPGATMPKLSVGPGRAPGTSDFEVEVGEGPRFGGYARFDNLGSSYTGVNRLSLGADYNSPFQLGDRLSVSAMSSESGGLLNGRVVYGLPLGRDGWWGELALGRTTYQLGQAYADLDATGHADTGELTLTYPVLRGRERNLTLSFNLANRHMRDELRAVDDVTTKRANAASVMVNHERYGQFLGLDGYASLGGGVTLGHLSVGDDKHRASNIAGVDTVGRYGKVTVTAAGRLALTDRLSVSSSVSLQKALFDKNLDSSEQLTISGTSGVMAFEQAASGDNGYVLGAEMRYSLPRLGGVDQAMGVFVNHGYVALQNNGWVKTAGRGTVEISDVGLAYTVSYARFYARVQASYVVGDWPTGLAVDGRTRTSVVAGLTF